MSLIKGIFGSSLGKKYVMAVSGMALFLFVVGHMVGNLQVFLGPEAINAYGHFLQSKKELVWAARLGLLTMLVLHIWSAIKLSQENRAARSSKYGYYKAVAASYASRTMLVSGLVIFTFVIYHLLHFTVRAKGVNLTGVDFGTLADAERRLDIYNMIVQGFSQPIVSIFYIVSMALLSLHLSHGVAAMFQSLGWKNKKYGAFIDRLALVAAGVLIVGYSSIPLAVLTGVLKRASYGS
jgi:succinate dehydrogenase / fumarate reductase cytochrome b subunit